ncbi:MAG: hypothetical protein Q9215_003904 [Flavoplaca cf. flavocitrina]
MSSTTVIELQPVVQGKTIIPPSTISAGQSGPRLSSERSLIQGDQSRLSEHDLPDLSTSRSAIIIAILTGIAAMTSMSTGILTVGLPDRKREAISWQRLYRDVDWVGAIIASSCLGLLSYVLAIVTGSSSSIREPLNATLLTIAAVLVPVFVYWVGRQEHLGKPALIPNSLWKIPAFTAVCLMVLISWGVMNSMEYFISLFYQEVQELSALQASLRFVPGLIVGFCLNVATGLLVHRFPANYLVIISTILCAGSPLLMALINPKWSYWYAAFWSMVLYPVSADVLFTISSLIIVDVFPAKTHALAGAVFNTVAQFGTSLGIAIMAVVASNVTRESGNPNKESPAALMEGYRVTFWLGFASMLLTGAVGIVGLRKAGKVGLKRE